MKSGLFGKLFLAILLAGAVIVSGMAISVQWSFERGLEDYLHRTEVEQLERLVPVLEKLYADSGGWELLRQSKKKRRLLWRILRRAFAAESQQRKKMGDKAFPDEAELSKDASGEENSAPGYQRHSGGFLLLPRLRLLDAQQNPVIGRPGTPPGETLLPLQHLNTTVGWVGLRRNTVITDRLALGFRDQQVQSYLLIALLAVFISALAAILLVRQLVKPVHAIAKAARRLGEGCYETRAEVTSNDELGRLADDFNRLARTLERNEQARREWIADISHELRTPLAVLRGEVEAMQDGIRQVDKAGLKSLHSEVLGLGKLVDDLYELALSDLGALDYHKENINLIEVLNETAALFQSRLQSKDLQFNNRVSPHEAVTVFADYRRLIQLFSNLLENSWRYTDAPGELELGIQTNDDKVIVSIQDSAPGVAQELQDKLFERLYRVDKSRSRVLGGAGLGLAICRNIVEAHAGRIITRPSPLGGLWISIELPRGA